MTRLPPRTPLILLLLVGTALLQLSHAQEPRFDPEQFLSELDSLRQQADQLTGYAPSQLEEALNTYEAAKTALRRAENPETARERFREARRSLNEAIQTARIAKSILAEVDAAREELQQVPTFEENRTARLEGGEKYKEALEQADEGDLEDAREEAREAVAAYREAARIALLDKELPEARTQLEVAEEQGRIPEPTYEELQNRLDQLEEEIEDVEGGTFGVASFYRRYRRRIRDEIYVIYPEFYRDPPDTLLVGDFTLVVDSFRTRGSWNFDRNQMENAAGVAWVSFACRPPLRIAPGRIPVHSFEVVEEVTNPEQQISLERALELEEEVEPGEQIRLTTPRADTLGRLPRLEELPQGALQPTPSSNTGPSAPPGGIRLAYNNARIKPTGRPQVGRVLAGQSRYPTQPPSPKDATLSIEGFTAHLDQITLTPSRSTATIELEFPNSIRDSTGRRARYSLGTLPITPDCSFHATHPDSTYGPWTVGETGIEVEGNGVVADFSEQWSWSGASTSQIDDWRGVILESGQTIAAADTVRSNTGYLQAKYTFADATVTEPGLQTTISLSERFVFETLQPAGYLVELRRGALQIDSSAVDGGGFPEGDVRLPPSVVRNAGSGRPIEASFASQLLVQRDLDLFGPLSLTQPLQWRRPLQSGSGRFEPLYSVTSPRGTFFFLSGTVRPEYRPSLQGQFRHPQLSGAQRPEVKTQAEAQGIQGLIVSRPGMATIHSPDVARSLTIPVDSGWVHVGGRGVNGMMVLRRDTPLNPQLGVPSRSLFEAPSPFDFSMHRPSGTPTTFELQFSDGALFESNGEGQIALGAAVQDSMAVRDVALTSTAQIPAVELDTTSHTVTLSYWGLDLVTQQNMRSPGVASVKTGVVYLTGAGLAEPRHFAEPFDLIWGEILADGRFKTEDLEMDLNALGQRMDQFAFTPTTLNLSPYHPGAPADTSYLQVGGTLHFALFGAHHLHVLDHNAPDSTGAPYNGRLVQLADTTGRGGIAATHRALEGTWGNGFAAMGYTFGYDAETQNGFSGPGSMTLSVLFPDGLGSTFRARNGRFCMNVREMNRADFRLGPVAHFGKATEITGCACLNEQTDELQRLALSASLTSANNVNVALRTARHGDLEFLHSPTVTETRLHGHYSLGTLVTDLVINGSARFTVNHAQDFVDGTLSGSFASEAGTGLIAGASLQASGTVDWHLGGGLGGDHYQHLQGRVQTDMMGGNILASAHAGAEGGFYVGINAPKSEAWVIQNADSRARVDMTPFPNRLTGLYGYLQAGMGINTILVGGGAEMMVGLGLFANVDPDQLSANPVELLSSSASNAPMPYGVGKMWVHVWGEILMGALRAEGTADLMLIGPQPFGFDGELTLGGCVGWVLCGDVTLGCGLNTARNGFYVD
jgi:tetratricopeptide (TPR) repeat protein